MRFSQYCSDSPGPVRYVLVIISITRVQWASYGNWEKPVTQLFWTCAILMCQTERLSQICLRNSGIFIYASAHVSCHCMQCVFECVCARSYHMTECYAVCMWVYTIAGRGITVSILFALSRHFLMILCWFLVEPFIFLTVLVGLLFTADVSFTQCHTAVYPAENNSLNEIKGFSWWSISGTN